MDYKVIKLSGFQVAGLELSGSYDQLSKMGNLWEQLDKTVDSTKLDCYGVFQDYEQCFSYYASVKTNDLRDIPSSMKIIKVPEHNYAVFIHKGYTEQVGETFEAAFKTLSEHHVEINAEAYKIEHYNATHDPERGDNEIELYIPILEK